MFGVVILPLTNDELLTTTRSVRRRLDLDKAVEPEVIEECLRLALQAPTASNRQGWEWVFVTDPDLKAGLAELYRRAGSDLSSVALPRPGRRRLQSSRGRCRGCFS